MQIQRRDFGLAFAAAALGLFTAPNRATAMLALPSPDAGPKRVALLIGNSQYWTIPSLKNPGHDASALSGKLHSLGFDSTTVLDATATQLKDAVEGFAEPARQADIALVFFAGSGVEVESRNRLLGIDCNPRDAKTLENGSIDIADVLSTTAPASGSALVFIDACMTSLSGSLGPGSRGLGDGPSNGGTTPDAGSLPPGFFVTYSSQPGKAALDGEGDDSPFTTALLAALDVPGLSLDEVMQRVRAQVWTSTQGRQLPWTVTTLTKSLVLHS